MERDRGSPTDLHDLLHDLRNVLGLVHVLSVDARAAHAAGEDIRAHLDDLVALASLATDVLRAQGRDGRAVRPFDVRAAAVCARTEERTIAVGELLKPLVVDADAGTLIDLVLAIARALGDGESRVDIAQDDDGALRFLPGVVSQEDLADAAKRVAKLASAAGVTVTASGDGNSLVLRAPPARPR